MATVSGLARGFLLAVTYFLAERALNIVYDGEHDTDFSLINGDSGFGDGDSFRIIFCEITPSDVL